MSDTILVHLLDAMDNGEQTALLTVVRATGAYEKTLGRHCILWLQPRGKRVGDLGLSDLSETITREAASVLETRQHSLLSLASDTGEVQVFVEIQKRPPRLIIVGAGHIAVPLTEIASSCDFHVTVMDDRRQFANEERFPTANRIIAGTLTSELSSLRKEAGFDNDTYVVLVTRGHQHDMDALIELIDDPIAYIGMIGSQRRIQAVFQLMESEKGITSTQLDHVYAPIGLDIGAHTPAEIAISIMAEIINILRGGSAVSLSDQIREQRRSSAK